MQMQSRTRELADNKAAHAERPPEYPEQLPPTYAAMAGGRIAKDAAEGGSYVRIGL